MGNDGSESSFAEIAERTMNFFAAGQQKYLSQRSEWICQIFTAPLTRGPEGLPDTPVCECVGTG